MTNDQSGKLPLSGVRVLDLSRVLAGPWATQILADFGADVLKVEAPGAGDDTRSWGPPNLPPEAGETAAGASAYFLSCNRNKRSVAIDLADPGGAALVRDLAARADVIVENFKVGGLARFGLDHATVKAINPRAVYCSITGFGQTGPYASRPGYDFVAQAMGGMMSITGEVDGPPIKPGVAMADVSTGLYACISILMALRHAEATGEGQQIDISLLDTQVSMLANQALNYLVSGRSPTRMGNAHPTIVPYRLFDTADGSIVIAVGNNSQFAALCRVLELSTLADDPRFATNPERVRNRDVLEPLIQQALMTRTLADLNSALAAANVPAGPVNSVADVFADPFIAARGSVHTFTRADGVNIPSVAFPAKLSATPVRYFSAPPDLGADTREALGDWLGLDAAAVDALKQVGAFGPSS